ncbi:TIGR03086 family metal-binding protein [Streptomyces sp. NPDC059853]|uniref:TIGR03086 family metal-binding protein n=1 Tax=Streptomyces sp. NPDC059853 TaxID=3346973 RepID=UPI0036686404
MTSETDIGTLLAAAARSTAPVVRGIGDDRLGDPTPCADYTVRGLLNHLFQVVIGFQELAARRPAGFATAPDLLGDDPGWRERFPVEAERLAAAWAVPGAEEGEVGAMGMPARTVARMALLDLTVHGWDLARAAGLPYAPDPAAVAECGSLVAELAPRGRETRVFGEPVPVPGDAAALDRLLGATGRDPRWTVRVAG